VRAMSPSGRMRNPGTGRSRRLRSRKAPARKSGGAFLPTARQTGPSHRDRRRSPDSGSLRIGSLAQRKACQFPTDLRPQHQLRPKAEHRHRRAHHNAWRGASVMPRPLDRKASLERERPGLPPRRPGRVRQSRTNPNHRRRTACPGKDATAREPAPLRFTPARQGQAGRRGPTLSRTARKVDPSRRSGQSHREGGEQNSVNKSTGRAHFIVPLSTERPTRRGCVDLHWW
jgi:hypothetical protein